MLLLFFAQSGLAQSGYPKYGTIKGHVWDTLQNKAIATHLYLPGFNRKTATDVNGNFLLEHIPAGTYTLKVRTLSYPEKTIEAITIQGDTVIELNFLFPPECIYIHNTMNCPVCNKKDEVIPVVYGMPTEKTMKKADQGKVKLGGCVVSDCEPKWYCKRDKRWF
ncbi:Carboxypeptidase regulatory-like domain-containing protein [Salinimicrobium catena]|uniref:Carboxypeptidase regulatory-like domain-containing protein n=1 Tax=Salinimicrobium catena TaxID=390640 RepID=A0A1H5P856_9FLAO|nr:Carboxypeptidase regulatory-like domain-containing protein [Salinimicrobium catena]SEF09900.1 Carboxypeptidase regulatory-like domain-containing protein [Salinimicrobium catena]